MEKSGGKIVEDKGFAQQHMGLPRGYERTTSD